MPNKHYINEVGTDLLFDTGIDIPGEAIVRVKYKDPAGLEGTWQGSAYSSYSELAGAIGTYFVKYTLASTSTLMTSGEWHLQPYIASSIGTWFGESIKEMIFGEYE
jgi:hypothetical protein